jgi:hypothetical protein
MRQWWPSDLGRRIGSPNGEPHLTGTRRALINTDLSVARFWDSVEACDTHFVTAMTFRQISGSGHQQTLNCGHGIDLFSPGLLVDFHEIAERDWKDGLLSGRERIDAQPVFQTRDQNGEAERIESAICEHEIFLSPSQVYDAIIELTSYLSQSHMALGDLNGMR